MTGSGNDFVVLDGRAHGLDEWPVERIIAICDRRTGVGADGLVLLAPDGPDTVRMHFYNADGSRAAMCGNAALCSTRFAGARGPRRPRVDAGHRCRRHRHALRR
jgi:diaminopimelate epimerase